MVTKFQEGNLILEYHYGTESGDEYDDYLTLPPIINEEEMDRISSGNESDAELMPTDML